MERTAGTGAGGGRGGSNTKYFGYTSYSSIGNGGNGGDGSPGYVRIEPVKPPIPVSGFQYDTVLRPVSGERPVYGSVDRISDELDLEFRGRCDVFTTTDPALRNANHTYTAAGTYSVTLTAGNSQGAQAISHPVYVTGPPAAPTQNPVEYTLPGIYNYTVAGGIGLIRITIVGAGGAGGGGSGGGGNGTVSHFGAPAGGGGSGYYNVSNISVAPGQTIPIVVGYGGMGGLGGLYDYRYFQWICGPGTDGIAGGYTQFGNITVNGGLPGTGSVCYDMVGQNGTGYHDGVPGTPTPPLYTTNARGSRVRRTGLCGEWSEPRDRSRWRKRWE